MRRRTRRLRGNWFVPEASTATGCSNCPAAAAEAVVVDCDAVRLLDARHLGVVTVRAIVFDIYLVSITITDKSGLHSTPPLTVTRANHTRTYCVIHIHEDWRELKRLKETKRVGSGWGGVW